MVLALVPLYDFWTRNIDLGTTTGIVLGLIAAAIGARFVVVRARFEKTTASANQSVQSATSTEQTTKAGALR